MTTAINLSPDQLTMIVNALSFYSAFFSVSHMDEEDFLYFKSAAEVDGTQAADSLATALAQEIPS